jgi:hypothetical protein
MIIFVWPPSQNRWSRLYVYSHYNMCSISIYFCNIRIKHLKQLKHLKHKIATCLKMPKNTALPVATAYLMENYGCRVPKQGVPTIND